MEFMQIFQSRDLYKYKNFVLTSNLGHDESQNIIFSFAHKCG